MRYATIDSDVVGPVLVVGDPLGLRQIRLLDGEGAQGPESTWRHDPSGLEEACAQLRAYFAGDLQVFDLDLAPVGTEFQRAAWDALQRIPYGRTSSYGDQAAALGRPTASRAVGAANGRNPLPIVVPCHRVVGRDGTLTGFRGGVALKRALLDHEARHASPLLTEATDTQP